MSNRLVQCLGNSKSDFGIMEVGSSLDSRIKKPGDIDYILFGNGESAEGWEDILKMLHQDNFQIFDIIDSSYRISDKQEESCEIGIVTRSIQDTKEYISDLMNPMGSSRLQYKTWAVGLEFPEGFAGDILSGKIHRDTNGNDIDFLKFTIGLQVMSILGNLGTQTVNEILNKLNQLKIQNERGNNYAVKVLEGTLVNLLIRLWYISRGRLGKGIKYFHIDSENDENENPILLSIKKIMNSNLDIDKLIALCKNYE